MSVESTKAGLDLVEWKTPHPLPDDLPPVLAFDPLLLPDGLSDWVVDISERMQCPPDFPAVGVMVALSAVVGRQIGIRPKRFDDWLVVPNLWGLIVGRPSVMKTPALSEVTGPIRELEKEASAEFEEALLASKADEIVNKQARKAADAAIQKALKSDDHQKADSLARQIIDAEDKERVVRRRYVTSDATVEALGEILSANPRGVLLYRDEIVGWLDSLDREGREGSRQFFLEAWNGYGSYTFDRIGRGTVDIESCCVSVLGGIQPGPLSRYLRSSTKGGSFDDGLAQRLQLAVWPDIASIWRSVDRRPNELARCKAAETFTRLDAISHTLPYVRFSDSAQECFDAWRHELENRIRCEEHPAVESHLAKYRSLVPSIALLHYLVENPEIDSVDDRSIDAAIAWAEYLESHARRIYASEVNAGVVAAKAILQKKDKLQSPFTARDIYRHQWRGLNREETEAGLEMLDAHGWVWKEEVPTFGRPKVEYRFHPEAS